MRSKHRFLLFVPGVALSLFLCAGPAVASKSRTELVIAVPAEAQAEAAGASCSSTGMSSTGAPALLLALGIPWLIRRRKR